MFKNHLPQERGGIISILWAVQPVLGTIHIWTDTGSGTWNSVSLHFVGFVLQTSHKPLSWKVLSHSRTLLPVCCARTCCVCDITWARTLFLRMTIIKSAPRVMTPVSMKCTSELLHVNTHSPVMYSFKKTNLFLWDVSTAGRYSSFISSSQSPALLICNSFKLN